MSKPGLKERQQKFIKAFQSGLYRYLCAAGSTGAGKSFVTIGLLHLLCRKIPGLRFAIFRKSEKNLKQTTIPSYNRIKQESRSVGDSIVVDMTAKYRNGSEILFVWADISKDPDLNNLRGLELTGALFEEANQIDKRYFDICKTRVGRWNNHLCPQFIMLNLNPSLGWVKDLFYDNWVNRTMPDGHYFEEFTINDNDSLNKNFIKGLEDLPDEEYNRFVRNVWDYSDIPNQLIKYEWYKQCKLDIEPDIIETDRHLLAIDPAWEGDDDTVFGQMHGNHIGWWESYPKQDPDISGSLGFQRVHEFKIKEYDLIVDPVGVGSATVLKLRNDLKFEPDLHHGGADPTDMFGVLEMFNKRSEAHWLLREALRKEEITFTHHPDFLKQCLAIKYSIDEKKIRIRPKQEIKKEIHESPGYVDVATMLIHRYITTNGDLSQQLLQRQLTPKEAVISSRATRERNLAIRQSKFGQ